MLRITFFIAILVSCALAFDQVKMVEEINSDLQSTWTAAHYPQFDSYTEDDLKAMMGFKPNEKIRNILKDKIQVQSKPDLLESLPKEFDTRKNWPNCTHRVLNQGQCGSCWAFGATESFEDRLCVESSEMTNIDLSVQQLVSCNMGGFEACGGGDPITAALYIAEYGLPRESCFPYVSGQNGYVPNCPSKCIDGMKMDELYYGKVSTIRWHISEAGIMDDIYHHGSVEGCFYVYSDFMNYQSGVYRYKSGGFLGGHCIKLLGWGEEDGVKYWLAQNSWGTNWGMDGFFKIERGVNMCGIEREALSIRPYKDY